MTNSAAVLMGLDAIAKANQIAPINAVTNNPAVQALAREQAQRGIAAIAAIACEIELDTLATEAPPEILHVNRVM